MSEASQRDDLPQDSNNLNRRDVLLASTAVVAASTIRGGHAVQVAQAQPGPSPSAGKPPNIVYFLVDNLGYGELGCYGGGILRGADTRRIDTFATEGIKLFNFAPEAQCTPSRSALMTAATRSAPATTLSNLRAPKVAWSLNVGHAPE